MTSLVQLVSTEASSSEGPDEDRLQYQSWIVQRTVSVKQKRIAFIITETSLRPNEVQLASCLAVAPRFEEPYVLYCMGIANALVA